LGNNGTIPQKYRFVEMKSHPAHDDMERVDEAKTILAKVNLQSQPKVLIELNRLARSDDVDFALVSELVARDVGMAAKMMKLASSPMYARGQKFGSVHEALLAIGLEEFRTCFTSVTLGDLLGSMGYPYKGFWEHSRKVAILCRELALRLQPRLANHAYTLGLFHDVGAVIIPLHHPAYCEHIQRTLPLYFGITELEFKLVKTNHCAVGELFGKNWGLNDDILLALRYHHRAEMDTGWSMLSKQLKAVLQLAELFNDKWDTQAKELADFESSREALARAGELLKFDGSDLADIEAMMKVALKMNV
jgi:HD-like signal output (HDOD) protein